MNHTASKTTAKTSLHPTPPARRDDALRTLFVRAQPSTEVAQCLFMTVKAKRLITTMLMLERY